MWPKLWLGIRDKSTSISTIICGCFAFLGNFFRWSTCALRDKGPVTPIVRSFTLTLVLCVGGDRKKITLISRSTYVLNAFAGRELQASIWDNRQSWKGNYMASDDSIVVLQFSCNLIGLYTKRFCSRSSTSLESLKCHHKFRACAHIGMPIFGISPLSLDLSQRCGSLLLPHLHPHPQCRVWWSFVTTLPLYHVARLVVSLVGAYKMPILGVAPFYAHHFHWRLSFTPPQNVGKCEYPISGLLPQMVSGLPSGWQPSGGLPQTKSGWKG